MAQNNRTNDDIENVWMRQRGNNTLYPCTHTHTYRGSGPNATISIGNIFNDDYNVLFTLCACYFVISSINKPINIQVLYSICRWQLVFSSLIRRCRILSTLRSFSCSINKIVHIHNFFSSLIILFFVLLLLLLFLLLKNTHKIQQIYANL